MKKVSEEIWIVDGEVVSWYGMPYTTRTTIVRLDSSDLWIHSPGKLNDQLITEVNTLGNVKYLVSPNKIHHLFMAEWSPVYPDSLLFSSPGLREKRKDINFDRDLKDASEPEWAEEIDQMIFKGSSAMDEVVFFHKKSSTLILTDLIENFHPNHFSGYKKFIAKITGIVSPNGKTPLDWRMSFMFGKKEARDCLDEMISWNPSRIIISHGECIDHDAVGFLRKSFAWLN